MQQKQKRENKETDSALGKAWYPNIWFSIIVLLLNYTIYYIERLETKHPHTDIHMLLIRVYMLNINAMITIYIVINDHV